ncbi:hypothetical protein ACS0TY_008389 [Phlomoides rotata]
MEAPPLSTSRPTTPTTPTPPLFSETVDFSSLSRRNSLFDTDPPRPAKIRLMCSYGGNIVPRPHDKTLCYVGGDTRIIVIDRHASLSDLHHRLSKNLFNNQPFSLKYQLPSEDLDSLITLTSDEDLENMVDEYDRLNNAGAGFKPGRIRLFLFPKSPSSIEQHFVETASTKSEDWFFNALNGKTGAASSDRGFSETSSLNCLLGFDDEFGGKTVVMEKDVEAQTEESKSVANGNFNLNYGINHDVHSIPGSPMLETTSSFGSTSSSPSVVNLPPIRVHVEENPKFGGSGIEEQFQQMSVGVVGNSNPPQKQEDMGFFMAAGVATGEYTNKVVSEDRKAQQIQLQPQQIPQFQQKQANNFDLASPDSASSVANPLSRQRQTVYQESPTKIQSGNTRVSSNQADHKTLDQSNSKPQMQPQFQESGYVVTGQYDQNQPQQFLHPNNQYSPSGAVPISSYYPVYPSQQQHQSILDQHYPFYFVHPNAPSSHSQTPPPATLAPQTRNAPSFKAEMVNGVYRTTAPQLVQVPSAQHQPQYVGYTQIHHPSSAPNSSYAYEFADPNHAQMYYTPLPPQLAAQYQTLTSAPDTFSQLPTENIKQQGRNSQG